MNESSIYRRLVGDFVPPRVFDFHAHLYRSEDLGEQINAQLRKCPSLGDLAAWQASQTALMGAHAPVNGMFFAFPAATMNVSRANEFVLNQVRTRRESRALLLIHPKDDPESLDLDAGWSGFKVYHVFAGTTQTQDATIDQFLPEWAWSIANQRHWTIMLHLVRRRSLADTANTDYIRRYCRAYPQAKLILAHAARGFAGAHTLEGIDQLAGLNNVFFDTSVVCEPLPLWAVLRTFGATRLLYGSDFPCSEWRGKPFSIGDGFYWIFEDSVDWLNWPLGGPIPAGIESLCAIKHAAMMNKLSDSDIERIFFDNAVSLLGLPQ